MSEAAPKSGDAGGRILVVDDNEANRDLLSRRLRRSGYEVDVAESGEQALTACEGAAYDAVVLDVMMPGMSGVEVLERLRARWGKTELPVIMATAKNDSVDVVEALNGGANDYVTKPIDMPILLARLRSHVSIKAESAARAGPVIDATFGIEPGTVIGERYEIINKLGEGGFASVYRAKQLSTGREVALKHARPELIRADLIGIQAERFRREMTLIGQLSHPHVVSLIDYGSIPLRRVEVSSRPRLGATRDERPSQRGGEESDEPPSHTQKKDGAPDSVDDVAVVEVPYMVLELLEGEALSEMFRREAPLEPSRAVDLVLPVVSALAAAHDRGVIHRDIKPSNIMLARDAQGELTPKVLDFGIAKLHEPDKAALTLSSSLIGTPQYMAPEQALGAKDVDERVDQFSVAAVLYEALTGRSPYQGDSLFELVSQVMRADCPPLGELRPGLPAELEEAVERALEGSRDRRFESMCAFGRALLPFAGPQGAMRWAHAFDKDGVETPRVVAHSEDRIRIGVGEERTGDTDPTISASVTLDKPMGAPAPATKPPWLWIAISAALALALVASLLR